MKEIKDMKLNVDVSIKLNNSEEFRNLVSEFHKKSSELRMIADELSHFYFEGEIENSVLSNTTDKQ